MELVRNEPLKKTEPASQETVTSIVDRIGLIAQKGEPSYSCFENYGELNPSEFKGYVNYTLKRVTLSEERRGSNNLLAMVRLKRLDDPLTSAFTFIEYQVFKDQGKLKMDKYEKSETEEDRKLKQDRSKRMNLSEKEELKAVAEIFKELSNRDDTREKMRKSGESIVGEDEALEILGILEKINNVTRKETDNEKLIKARFRKIFGKQDKRE